MLSLVPTPAVRLVYAFSIDPHSLCPVPSTPSGLETVTTATRCARTEDFHCGSSMRITATHRRTPFPGSSPIN
jgi:hypothetical protein